MDLNSNYIFVNGTHLVSVDISGNQLEGKFPPSLINCISLEFLNVKSNRIKDTFPSWLADPDRLRSNGFTNNIPQSLANLTNLEALDLSRNKLSACPQCNKESPTYCLLSAQTRLIAFAASENKLGLSI
ncbi:BnaC08g11150D [Brassica napus]|uniref:BnaC08g11150D protein n=1 Tax=Brassica napus TaxID=3708 RepID=A0A078F2Y8_BRANA|nr:BnaC08g11150D [Brassica napus]